MGGLRGREVVGRCRAYRASDRPGPQESHPSPGVQPARSEPRPPASGGGDGEMTATWTCPATRCPRPSASCPGCR